MYTPWHIVHHHIRWVERKVSRLSPNIPMFSLSRGLSLRLGGWVPGDPGLPDWDSTPSSLFKSPFFYIHNWTPYSRLIEIRGWVQSGFSPIRGWVQSGLSPSRGWVQSGFSPFGVQSHSGLSPIQGWVQSGFSPIRGSVQSGLSPIWGCVQSGFSPFEVQSIRGWVFLGSVFRGSVVRGSVGESKQEKKNQKNVVLEVKN